METINQLQTELKTAYTNYKNLEKALKEIPKNDSDRKQIASDKLRIACNIEKMEFALKQRKNEQSINVKYDYQGR